MLWILDVLIWGLGLLKIIPLLVKCNLYEVIGKKTVLLIQ